MEDLPPPPPPPPPSDDLAPPPPPPTSDDLPPPPPPAPPVIHSEKVEEVEDAGSKLKKRKIGWATKTKPQPISIEELLAKKKAADEAAAKPRFMSKKERERLKQEQEAATSKPEINGKPNGVTHGHTNGHVNGNAPNGVKGSHRDVPTGPRGMPTGPRAMRAPQPALELAKKGFEMKLPPPPKPRGTEEVEANMIRTRYMGADTQVSNFSAKKKRKRTTEKKFNFEWNTEEDTSQDYNPIYQNRQENTFFGRGKLGGYTDDASDEQVQKYAQSLAERDPETGRERAAQIIEAHRRRREEGARNTIEKHWSEKPLEKMRERDWRIFKEDFNIASKGGNIPNPMRSWKESHLPQRLLDIVDQVGYTEPSAVQRAAIPVALQSRDLIGVAVTGSGKTAAFLLPLLVYISDLPPLNDATKNDGPYAIILAPTRELAQQIEIEAKKFATPLGFKCVSLVGGHSIEEQSYNMRDGAEIIIATPGRLVDCIDRRVLVLSQCCYVIMDEADRMIDMGFEEGVNRILNALPVNNEKPDTEDAEDAVAMSRTLGGKDRYRQTMMYTATMPAAVERIARRYLRRPAIVTIGNLGEAVDTVEQRVEFISGEDKRKKRLNEILASREFTPPIIVFVNTKRNCDAVARDISRMGYNSVTMHGNKAQDQREAALASLRSGAANVLIATDVAARGIDVPDVSLVVNYNMASSIENYTHRIGRTGRAGKTGVAITFLGQEDADVMYELRLMMQKSEISRVPEELRKHASAQTKVVKGQKKIE